MGALTTRLHSEKYNCSEAGLKLPIVEPGVCPYSLIRAATPDNFRWRIGAVSPPII